MKKILPSLLLVLAMISLFGCTEQQQKDTQKTQAEPTKTAVFIGDSIAEALLGPSPECERESLAYYALIGEMNRFTYINRAVSGATVGAFVEALTETGEFTEEAGYERIKWIRDADYIFVSMGGNDLLGDGVTDYVLSTGENFTAGNRTLSEDWTERMNRRIRPRTFSAIEKIYELNPDVTIFWQTLYNPVTEDSVLISEDDWERYNDSVKEGLIAEEYTYRVLTEYLVNDLNGILYEYKSAHPEKNFIIPDVHTAFNEIYEKDESAMAKLIYSDWIHPSAYGHAVIAQTLQSVLEENGLAADNALKVYREICTERAERMYESDIVSRVAQSVKKADTMSAVTEAYFDATEGTMPKCEANVTPKKNAKALEENKFFTVYSVTAAETEMTTVNFSGLDVKLIDTVRSGIEFRDDGTFTVTLAAHSGAYQLVNTALNQGLLSGVDLQNVLDSEFCPMHTTYSMYFEEMFPGFALSDLDNTVELLSSCGVSFVGIDRDSQAWKDFCEDMKDGTLSSDFTVPTDFALELNGYYDAVERDGYTVMNLYLVRTNEHTLPLYCCAVKENELLIHIEFAHIKIRATYSE